MTSALGSDYDDDPGRFAAGREVVRRHGLAGDVHPVAAARLVAGGCRPVLDVGGGAGELARHLPPGWWIGLDPSPAMLRLAPSPVVLADGGALPVRSGSTGGVAALWMLYHLADPVDIVGSVFDDIDVHRWDAPLLELPDRAAVEAYLIGRLVPREQAAEAAARVRAPLRVTKRGVLVVARRDRR